MSNKQKQYELINAQVQALISGEPDMIANMANIAAVLFNNLERVNWAGFYLYKQDQLVLGPFQGQPACIRIPMGKGVCGTAASRRETMVVMDVHEFAGHIACDAASNSEVVVPIVVNDQLIGVLDIDSPITARFDDDDRVGLETLVSTFEASLTAAEVS
ncbi:GAF domain-containing protein [Brumicola nitratireducens]|uniref:GAF domain-containing protein n=1 Tax=Glaciecola nitratireducens (strain JCM 12485 / KCTC 12276 / FR1064) TaxID=1085623 RepID=G4QHL6_GLANF|nr:GAF domain-containing protein [Glaciecola nitratireducens]AEP30002.1 GAF domain-containing protein [Glaciecola nitratireducens FR1064]